MTIGAACALAVSVGIGRCLQVAHLIAVFFFQQSHTLTQLAEY